jgi:hypothetical protein
MVLYSENNFSPVFGPSSRAERLNAKKISDEDHDAILEEIGRREGLGHDEEASSVSEVRHTQVIRNCDICPNHHFFTE